MSQDVSEKYEKKVRRLFDQTILSEFVEKSLFKYIIDVIIVRLFFIFLKGLKYKFINVFLFLKLFE